MTNEDILQKAIEKAEKNGFKTFRWYVDERYFDSWLNDGEGRYKQEYTIIFSHDFAKAFWGEDLTWIDSPDEERRFISGWAYHLQNMVLEEEPLLYLKKFL